MGVSLYPLFVFFPAFFPFFCEIVIDSQEVAKIAASLVLPHLPPVAGNMTLEDRVTALHT